jgi:hypothetical protein
MAVARMLVSAITGWHLQESGARVVPLEEMLEAVDRTVNLFMAARSSW